MKLNIKKKNGGYYKSTVLSFLTIPLLLGVIKIATHATIEELITYLLFGHVLLFWPLYSMVYDTSFENVDFIILSFPLSIIQSAIIFYLIYYVNKKVKKQEIRFAIVGVLVGLLLWLLNTLFFWKTKLIEYPKYLFDITYLSMISPVKIYSFVLLSIVLGGLIGYLIGMIGTYIRTRIKK